MTQEGHHQDTFHHAWVHSPHRKPTLEHREKWAAVMAQVRERGPLPPAVPPAVGPEDPASGELGFAALLLRSLGFGGTGFAALLRTGLIRCLGFLCGGWATVGPFLGFAALGLGLDWLVEPLGEALKSLGPLGQSLASALAALPPLPGETFLEKALSGGFFGRLALALGSPAYVGLLAQLQLSFMPLLWLWVRRCRCVRAWVELGQALGSPAPVPATVDRVHAALAPLLSLALPGVLLSLALLGLLPAVLPLVCGGAWIGALALEFWASGAGHPSWVADSAE